VPSSSWPLRGSASETGERAPAPERAEPLAAAPERAAFEAGAAADAREPLSDWDESDETAEFDRNDGDLDRRRAELRDRIRAIGLRRSGARPVRQIESEAEPDPGRIPAADAAKPAQDEGALERMSVPASAQEVRERISLTLAAARQRRGLLTQPSS
jgi:hypothetical protein